MDEDNSRGTVGIVRPTQRTGGFEELLSMLPRGVRLIPLCLDVRRGGLDEFKSAIPAYEEKVAEFARIRKLDLDAQSRDDCDRGDASCR